MSTFAFSYSFVNHVKTVTIIFAEIFSKQINSEVAPLNSRRSIVHVTNGIYLKMLRITPKVERMDEMRNIASTLTATLCQQNGESLVNSSR